MKTPKEIIDKYFPSGLHEDPEQSELNKIFIFNAMEEYASQFKSQSDNPTQMSNTKEWTTPNENDEIDVPDELMPLFNQIGTQIRLHTISGKNEVLTVAHCVRNAQKFFQSRISELEAENKRLREKAEKWDALADKMEKFYAEDSDADLVVIGEEAAAAFGYL